MRRTGSARRISKRRGIPRRPRARIRAATKNAGFPGRLGAATVSAGSRLAVQLIRAFDGAAAVHRRGVAVARITLHEITIRSAAAFVAARALTARIGQSLRNLANLLRRGSIGAMHALSGMAVRLAATVVGTAARFAGVFGGLTAWARGRIAGLGTVRPGALAVGLGAAAAVFALIAMPWTYHPVSPLVDLAAPATTTDDRDIEEEVATAPIPSRDPFSDSLSMPPVYPYLPNENLVTKPLETDPGSMRGENNLATLPVRPRARPPRVQPRWLANAVEPDLRGAGPLIAIVIDDAGVAQERTARAIKLPGPLTMAFIPYSDNLERQTRAARAGGHELMLHIPMEPGSAGVDPGHNALLTSLDEDEIMRRFRWALGRFDGYVGVNNHMGSKFMARAELVEPLLAVMREQGLLFLDSRTTADTAGTGIARRLGLPNTDRDVFLDNELTVENVTAQLTQAERVARRQGYAVAIGHTHDVTVKTLAEWIPRARARGFTLVPVSAIVRREYGAEYEKELAAAIPAGGEAEGLLGRP